MAFLDEIGIIDVDTHLPEPPDLWTSRMPAKWGDKIPHVRWDEATQQEMWVIGDRLLIPAAKFAYAGWSEHTPLFPPRWEDAEPITWDAKLRLAQMDEYGVVAQILYPNVALFSSSALQGGDDAELAFGYVRAYNDFQTEWSAVAPDRLLPMTTLPFWDLDATLKEMRRYIDAGHRGLVFTQDPGSYGLPALVDRHWDPIWALAQEAGLPVNFHVASQADIVSPNLLGSRDSQSALFGTHAAVLPQSMLRTTNARTIAEIISGGLCHRFPALNFVSVESDIGWMPYLIEWLDWLWVNAGVHKEHPEYDLMPSEYFKRQIYGCLLFEGPSGCAAIEQLGDTQFMFETDFPHPGSMAPGPASNGMAPKEYIEKRLSSLSEESLRKILHDNAARIYHLT